MKKHSIALITIFAVFLVLWWIYKRITGEVASIGGSISKTVSNVGNAIAAPYNDYYSWVDNSINGQSQDLINSPALPLPPSSNTPSADPFIWFAPMF